MELDKILKLIYLRGVNDGKPGIRLDKSVAEAKQALIELIDKEMTAARLLVFEKLQDFALKNNYDPEIIRGYVVGAILSIGEQLKPSNNDKESQDE